MMYGNGSPEHHRHKHHHARQYQRFDSSNGYPVYATTLEPMPLPEGHHYQYGNPIFNNYMEYVPEESRRIRVVEYEPARIPVHAKVNKKKIEENVDAEAEEFIQHEHKKFILSKQWSEMSGP